MFRRLKEDRPLLLILSGVAAGFCIRAYVASRLALNPDEAWQAMLSLQPTLRMAWTEALTVHHPPLLLLLEYFLGPWLLHEIGVRLIPMLASAFAPLIAFCWLRRRSALTAASVAFVLLQFGPRMVSLGAQNRSYSLALLLVLTTLYCLDRAIEKPAQWAWYAAAGLCWCLAAFSDYSVALVCPGIAVYAAWRHWENNASAQNRLALALCVGAVLATYGFLFVIQVQPLLATRDAHDEAWLEPGFPGDDPLFAIRSFGYQFLYLLGLGRVWSIWYAALPVALFAISVLRNRSWWALAVLPFAAATVAAYAKVFPYTAYRHTMLLGVPIVIMIALLAEQLVNRPRLLLAAIVPLTLVWLGFAPRDPLDLPPTHLVPADHRAAAQHVIDHVPKMQPMLATGEAFHSLRYYTAQNGGFAPVIVPTPQWRLLNEDELQVAVNALRANAGLDPSQRIWFVEGEAQSLGRALGWNTGPLQHGILVYPLPKH
jgi:4-amino-4-deoxy-L-arabinose transferase-like glycosyltransferase